MIDPSGAQCGRKNVAQAGVKVPGFGSIQAANGEHAVPSLVQDCDDAFAIRGPGGSAHRRKIGFKWLGGTGYEFS